MAHHVAEQHLVAYYRAIAPYQSAESRSVAIGEGGDPLILFRSYHVVSPEGRSMLALFSRPAAYYEADAPADRMRGARRKFREVFSAMSERVDEIRVDDVIADGRPSFLSRLLFDRGGEPRLAYRSTVDLSVSEAEIHRELSSSFQSSINWGRRNLSLSVLERDGMTAEAMAAFRDLHRQAAGRDTRPPESWDRQLDMVRAGEAYVVNAHSAGRLVSASLFVSDGHTASYGVSASDRALFDKPLSHAVVWAGICHAKELGCLYFDVGNVLFPYSGASDKELGISRFKRSFGMFLQPQVTVALSGPVPARA